MTHRRTRTAGRAVRLVLGALALALLAGCQLRTEMNVTVAEDGSGAVEVGIGLDDDAMDERPDLLEELEFGDLADAGWEVTSPAEEDDGFTWVRVRREFAHPAEVAGLVEQVAGPDGPFRDFRLARDDAFAETVYRFAGTVDFARGVGSLTDDPELAEALGAEPVELIGERIGRAVDELVQVQVAVRLPGDVSSNAPTRASNGAIWRPSVLEREAVELSASSTIARTERLAWAAVAVVGGLALVAFLMLRFRSRGRSRVVAGGS